LNATIPVISSLGPCLSTVRSISLQNQFLAAPIIITPKAEKRFRKIPDKDRLRVQNAILALAESPYPDDCELLKGVTDFFRIRVGDYRIIYTVSGSELIVLVVKIGHRRDVYRMLKNL